MSGLVIKMKQHDSFELIIDGRVITITAQKSSNVVVVAPKDVRIERSTKRRG